MDTCAGGRSDRLPISRRSGVFSEQWALAPLAISLGLAPRHPTEADRVPLRARVEELISDGMLPEDCVYVGQGHHSHRLKRTKWASPFTPGQDVPLDEWLRRYVQWVMETLSRCLHELQGVTLVCVTASTEVRVKQPCWQAWCLMFVHKHLRLWTGQS